MRGTLNAFSDTGADRNYDDSQLSLFQCACAIATGVEGHIIADVAKAQARTRMITSVKLSFSQFSTRFVHLADPIALDISNRKRCL
jgi:hypothetical protein